MGPGRSLGGTFPIPHLDSYLRMSTFLSSSCFFLTWSRPGSGLPLRTGPSLGDFDH